VLEKEKCINKEEKVVKSRMKKKKCLIQRYDRESPQYKEISRHLAVFVGGSNVSNSIVENTKFIQFIEALKPLILLIQYHVGTLCQMKFLNC
jgi:hypothetical protein